MGEIPGSEFEEDVDLVLLAMGFTGPEKGALLSSQARARRARQRQGRRGLQVARRACSHVVTCAVVSRSWFGPSGRVARPRAASTSCADTRTCPRTLDGRRPR